MEGFKLTGDKRALNDLEIVFFIIIFSLITLGCNSSQDLLNVHIVKMQYTIFNEEESLPKNK